MRDISGFIAWQAEKPDRRHVDIEIESYGVRIWVWDDDLCEGQYVNSVEEIDIENRKELQERAEYERLQKKFA